MLNVKAALESAGATFNDVVRLDTFVVASAINEYRSIGVKTKHDMLGVRVGGATVFVAGLMIPDAMIEIEAIAAID
jgi:enamine deaminase RidA (YjgF/YER057c/UK114 family)